MIRLLGCALVVAMVGCEDDPAAPEERVPTTIDIEIVEPPVPDSVCVQVRFTQHGAECVRWGPRPPEGS